MKAIINSLLAASVTTFAESMVLGRALGLSVEMHFDVFLAHCLLLVGGTANSLRKTMYVVHV